MPMSRKPLSELSQVTLYRRLAEASAIMEELVKAGPDQIAGLRGRAENFLKESAERRAEVMAKAQAASVESKKQKFAEGYARARERILELLASGVTSWKVIGDKLLAEGIKPPRSDNWRFGLLVKIAPEIRVRKTAAK